MFFNLLGRKEVKYNQCLEREGSGAGENKSFISSIFHFCKWNSHIKDFHSNLELCEKKAKIRNKNIRIMMIVI